MPLTLRVPSSINAPASPRRLTLISERSADAGHTGNSKKRFARRSTSSQGAVRPQSPVCSQSRRSAHRSSSIASNHQVNRLNDSLREDQCSDIAQYGTPHSHESGGFMMACSQSAISIDDNLSEQSSSLDFIRTFQLQHHQEMPSDSKNDL